MPVFFKFIFLLLLIKYRSMIKEPYFTMSEKKENKRNFSMLKSCMIMEVFNKFFSFFYQYQKEIKKKILF